MLKPYFEVWSGTVSANKSRSIFSIIAISFMAAFSSPSNAAVAQNNDASMDSMFNETAGKKGDTAAKKSADSLSDTDDAAKGDADAHSRGHILGVPKLRRKVASATPLATVEAFAKSPIVQGSAWPGIGPFKPSADDSSLVDGSQNTMKIDAGEQKQITGIELQLNGKSAREFLGVEMAVDFLLEALGTRPARIADFNAGFEKTRTKIFGKDRRTATFSAGRYSVAVTPDHDDLGKLTVKVNNTDADTTATDHSETSTAAATVGHPLSKLAQIFNTIKAKPSDSDAPKPPTQIAVLKPAQTNSPESLKDTVKALIENWQKIKRNAVKNRDVSELPNVLTGHALEVQTKGIKWLSDNHKFYEMVPKNVEVSTVTETIKGKKYAVLVTVKESSKLYDEQTNKLLRDAEDTYLVNYTVEKQGDNYLISDSSIVKIQTPQDPLKKR